MLTEEKTEFNKLSEAERRRHRETYFTFFGRIAEKSQWQIFRNRAPFIKASLDRIARLTIETWPTNTKVYCDSSYFQDKGRNGKSADQFQTTVLREGTEIKYDAIWNRWFVVSKLTNCGVSGAVNVGFTSRTTSLNSKGETVSLDRITFCPFWFRFIKNPPPGETISPPSKALRQGYPLKFLETEAAQAYDYLRSSTPE